MSGTHRYGLYLADLRRARNDSHGIINYALGLAGALPAVLADDEELVVYAPPSVLEELDGLEDGAEVHVVPESDTLARRLASDHLASPRWARRDRLDLLHYPKGFVPLWSPATTHTVATVHDDIAVRSSDGTLPGLARGAKGRYFRWATLHSLRAAGSVVTVSAFSASRLARLGGGTAPVVVPEASTLPLVDYVPLADRRPVLLHLGAPYPHKRTALALEWSARYRRDRRPDLGLLVLGPLDLTDEARVAADGVERRRGVLTNGEMAELLASTRALLFTSVYEGFGLPPVEAWSQGTPSTFARVAAMPEVLAGLPGGHEPDDYDGFAAALDELLALDDASLLARRAELRERYSWASVAARVRALYRGLVDEHG